MNREHVIATLSREAIASASLLLLIIVWLSMMETQAPIVYHEREYGCCPTTYATFTSLFYHDGEHHWRLLKFHVGYAVNTVGCYVVIYYRLSSVVLLSQDILPRLSSHCYVASEDQHCYIRHEEEEMMETRLRTYV